MHPVERDRDPEAVSTRTRILVADDQPDVLEALRLLLSQYDFSLHPVTSPRALLEQLPLEDWDLMLIDLNYSRDTTSGDEGLQLLTAIRAARPTVPIVVMTAWGNIDLAVEAMRRGAQSFVQKPWDNAALVQVLQREIATGRAAREQSERHARETRESLLIQRALMPSMLPTTERVQVVGAWQPAGSLGGDCYDAFTFAADVVGLSIADVAGKGLPAALLMSSLQAAVRAFAMESSPPEVICASVNRLLCGQMIAGRFATLCYLRVDAGQGVVKYANAGHNPPLLARVSGEIERLHAGGTVLGVFPDATFAPGQAHLTAGDRLLLYTDGITEARNGNDEEYGEERLTAALRRYRHLDAAGLHSAVLADVTSFASLGFQDDATLLAVAVR
jgi:sigma-B regulation protein RsbU (phosphoserine phosphatase)